MLSSVVNAHNAPILFNSERLAIKLDFIYVFPSLANVPSKQTAII